MNYKIIEEKLKYQCEKHNTSYTSNNYYNIEKILSIGDLHGDFTLLLNILYKYDIIKVCSKNNNSIHIKYQEYYNKNILDYYVELNKIYDNFLIIQVGDQIDIREMTNKNFVDNSENIVKFINKLRHKIELLQKNYHFISLYGNHELNSIEKSKERKKFFYDNKYNYICNYKLIVNVNNNYIFIHSGLVKDRIKKYFDNYIKHDMTMKEKIDIFNIIINYILMKNYYKNNNNNNERIGKILSIRDYERPEKYNIKPIKSNNNMNLYDMTKYKCDKHLTSIPIKKYCPFNEMNKFIDYYELYTINNMIIGHNAGYKTDILKYNMNNKEKNIFIIDNLKSRAYNENSTYYDNNIPSALLIDTINNNYSFIY